MDQQIKMFYYFGFQNLGSLQKRLDQNRDHMNLNINVFQSKESILELKKRKREWGRFSSLLGSMPELRSLNYRKYAILSS